MKEPLDVVRDAARDWLVQNLTNDLIRIEAMEIVDHIAYGDGHGEVALSAITAAQRAVSAGVAEIRGYKTADWPELDGFWIRYRDLMERN